MIRGKGRRLVDNERHKVVEQGTDFVVCVTKGGERCGDVDVKQENGGGGRRIREGSGESLECVICRKFREKSKFCGPNFFAVERCGDLGQPITLQRSSLLSSRRTDSCPRNAGISRLRRRLDI